MLGKMEGSSAGDNEENQNHLYTAIPGWSCRGPRDRIVSSGPSSPRTGHVTSLAVLPGFRRCGAAKQLMDMLHDRVSFFRYVFVFDSCACMVPALALRLLVGVNFLGARRYIHIRVYNTNLKLPLLSDLLFWVPCRRL